MNTNTEFDLQRDPEATAKFIEWQTKNPAGLVLNELAAGRYMLHLAECSHLDDSPGREMTRARKICNDQWEFLAEEARGAEFTECSSCKPRRELREAFVAFRKQCIWLRGCFNMFEHLFHAAEARRVLQKTAAHFFHDLNLVLLEYGLLQAAKITDPARSWSRAAKAHVESLTVCNLNEHLQREGLMNQAIETAAAGVMRYRDFIAGARNKVIAHIDKTVAVANQSIGEHPAEEVEAFLAHMQDYNDEVGRVVGEGPLDFTVQAGQGDAITLLQFLRVGLHAKNTDLDGWFAIANKPVHE